MQSARGLMIYIPRADDMHGSAVIKNKGIANAIPLFLYCFIHIT